MLKRFPTAMPASHPFYDKILAFFYFQPYFSHEQIFLISNQTKMDLVLLRFFTAAALIFFSLRLARSVVRNRISLLSMFLYNFVSFALIWGFSLSLKNGDTLLFAFGYGIGAIFAAYVFLLHKRKKHNPDKITVADLESGSDFAGLKQNQLTDLRRNTTVRRGLYNEWFRNYLIQTVILTGIFSMLSTLS